MMNDIVTWTNDDLFGLSLSKIDYRIRSQIGTQEKRLVAQTPNTQHTRHLDTLTTRRELTISSSSSTCSCFSYFFLLFVSVAFRFVSDGWFGLVAQLLLLLLPYSQDK